MKRIFAVFMLLGAAMFLAAACSGENAAPANTAPESSMPATAIPVQYEEDAEAGEAIAELAPTPLLYVWRVNDELRYVLLAANTGQEAQAWDVEGLSVNGLPAMEQAPRQQTPDMDWDRRSILWDSALIGEAAVSHTLLSIGEAMEIFSEQGSLGRASIESIDCFAIAEKDDAYALSRGKDGCHYGVYGILRPERGFPLERLLGAVCLGGPPDAEYAYNPLNAVEGAFLRKGIYDLAAFPGQKEMPDTGEDLPGVYSIFLEKSPWWPANSYDLLGGISDQETYAKGQYVTINGLSVDELFSTDFVDGFYSYLVAYTYYLRALPMAVGPSVVMHNPYHSAGQAVAVYGRNQYLGPANLGEMQVSMGDTFSLFYTGGIEADFSAANRPPGPYFALPPEVEGLPRPVTYWQEWDTLRIVADIDGDGIDEELLCDLRAIEYNAGSAADAENPANTGNAENAGNAGGAADAENPANSGIKDSGVIEDSADSGTWAGALYQQSQGQRIALGMAGYGNEGDPPELSFSLLDIDGDNVYELICQCLEGPVQYICVYKYNEGEFTETPLGWVFGD